VLNPWNIDSLVDVERRTGKKIYNILQLRLHPSIIALKKMVEESAADMNFDVELTYITARGNWYHSSWKGDQSKSGGIATNIGVHFFDMLYWIFGKPISNKVHVHETTQAAGLLEFARARVKWFLSIDAESIPIDVLASGKRTFRSLSINGENFEFSDGFTELHLKSYQNILEGDGFGLEQARSAIEIVHDIRTQQPLGLVGEYHSFAAKK
jgi:UDP-N-acetyl-2-amino-2-deoxyglucuronate dehydrogenase